MKVALLLTVALLMPWLGLTSTEENKRRSLDPGEQAKVSTALDSAQSLLETMNGELKAQSKIAASNGDVFKLMKVASAIGRSLQMVQVAGAVFSFISTFLMPSQIDVILDVINERFKEVNQKNDRIDEKLDEIEKSIMADGAFITLLPQWMTAEKAIKNGAKKLSEIRTAMTNTSQRIEQVKLAEEYVNYYDNNNLHGHMLNIYKMAARAETLTTRNVFDWFIATHGRDVRKLSKLMIIIRRVMTSAAQQTMAYYYLKGNDDRARDCFKDVQTYFFDIRRAFEWHVWSILSNSVRNAKADARRVVKAIRDKPRVDVVQAIYNNLIKLHPWYTWAVAKWDKPGITGLKSRGLTWFSFKNDTTSKEEWYVVFEDTKAITLCSNISQAKTLLVFIRCDGCNDDYNACGIDRCNGHGHCKGIPFTRKHQCICELHFGGESCEKRIDFNDTITALLAELRRQFNIVNGVPTPVDNYFALGSLSEKLSVVLEKIRASFPQTNNIVKHSGVIYHAESIADLYAKQLKNNITFDQFGNTIEEYLKINISSLNLQNRLKTLILSQGLLDKPGHDIYNSYKREYLGTNGGGCTKAYNTEVEAFRDILAYLDQAVGEALLLHKVWLLETQGTTDALRARYQKEADDVFQLFKGRQQLYKQYWESHSCGPISVSGTNVECKDQLTSAGMSLPVKCDQQRQPTQKSLKCVLGSNGTLVWDSSPVCKFVWDRFGNWGNCSKICDGGVKYRYRQCLGTTDVNKCVNYQGGSNRENTSCNTTPCCTDKNGKFKCSNGKCIQKSWLCDGDNDCGNRNDENRSQCPYLWAACLGKDKFKCSNGKCIWKSWLCDGDDDCGNGNDERWYRCGFFG